MILLSFVVLLASGHALLSVANLEEGQQVNRAAVGPILDTVKDLQRLSSLPNESEYSEQDPQGLASAYQPILMRASNEEIEAIVSGQRRLDDGEAVLASTGRARKSRYEPILTEEQFLSQAESQSNKRMSQKKRGKGRMNDNGDHDQITNTNQNYNRRSFVNTKKQHGKQQRGNNGGNMRQESRKNQMKPLVRGSTNQKDDIFNDEREEDDIFSENSDRRSDSGDDNDNDDDDEEPRKKVSSGKLKAAAAVSKRQYNRGRRAKTNQNQVELVDEREEDEDSDSTKLNKRILPSTEIQKRNGQIEEESSSMSGLQNEEPSASHVVKDSSTDLETAAGHHHGKSHGHYYQHASVPKKKAWKFGFKRGNHKHTIKREEKGYKNKFHSSFKWHAKEKCKKKKKCKSVGKMTWEYKHHDKKKHHHH